MSDLLVRWPTVKIDACGIAGIVGVGALAWMLGVAPALEHRGAQDQQRSSVTDVGAEAISVEGSARKREEMAKLHLTTIASLGVELRPVGQLNPRLGQITELAKSSGVNLNQIGPGIAGTLGLAVTVPIKLSGTTSYAEARKFLNSLRLQFPDMAVSGLKLNRGAAVLEAENPQLSAEFNLVWYALPAGREGRQASASPESP